METVLITFHNCIYICGLLIKACIFESELQLLGNPVELILYVVTPTEVSRYNPEANTLTTVNTGDFRKYSTMQDFATIAPINIVLVVDTSKQERGEFQGYTAGAASQNIYLYCAQAGLKSVVRAGFDRENLPKALKLSANERILFVQTVGK